MSRSYRAGRLLALTPIMCVLIVCPTSGRAQSDYHDKDFSVRMASAFIRFTEVSALGGETVANRFSSAINPASTGWFPLPGKFGLVAAPYYSTIGFDEGARLHVTGESLTWDTRSWGTFQPTLSQIRSNDSKGSDDLSFDYRVDIAQLQWGKRFGDLGLGSCFNFARTLINRDGTVSSPLPVRVDADGSAESYRWRFGGLYQPAKKWLFGTIFEYGFQPFRSRTDTWMSLLPLLPPIAGTDHDDGIQQQFIVRPGVSYEYAPMSTVYVDYQYGVFFNHNDTLNSHIITAGIEHRLLEWLFGRVGPTFDARGNVGFSAGASVFLARWCSLDLGYQYNMLWELQHEFGRANTLQATLSFRF
jgi:hypothetical protein